MDFKLFLEEYNRLKSSLPHPPPYIIHSEDSDSGDYLAHCKNAYYNFDTSYSQDNVYVFDSFQAINCIDDDYIAECENCYNCTDTFKTNNCVYLSYCARTFDSYFCFDCNDSHHLFGCVYLNHKNHCIFNRQYSEEEYFKKIKELLNRAPLENIGEMKNLLPRFPVTTTTVSHAENSDYGNHVHYSKNMYLCFDCARSEDCAYCYDSHRNKNCFDLTQTFSSEYCYECTDSNKLNNCQYVNGGDNMYDSSFCDYCGDSHHLFGCVALNHKEYCILNKQYSKEEYEQKVREIMVLLK